MLWAQDYARANRDEMMDHAMREVFAFVGTGRETINNQLALWRSAGIVDTGRRAVAIRNCEAMWALVGCV